MIFLSLTILMKNLKQFIIIFLLLILFIFVSAFSYVNAVFDDISNSIFRLHVIANSDSENDQNLKYLVRDKVLEYMNTLTSDVKNKAEAIEIVKAHKNEFYEVAKKVIEENGYSYDVKINVGNFYFPTKTYGDISFPAGNYDALKIEIGEAKGRNWWCVMFPPLCFVDVTSGVVPDESKEIIEENLSSEEYTLISESDNFGVKVKFKLIEMFENL